MDTEMILASSNKHKLDEIINITKKYGIVLKTLDEAGLGDLDIEENGMTFEENSLIKAKTVCELTSLPAIGDDSGLMVDALDGAPGVYSARYSGEDKNYDANNKKLLMELDGVSEENRAAKFVTVITLYYPDGKTITARGEVKGHISLKEKGNNGFGYDPLFVVDGYGKTFAELSSEEKNKMSHRARALEKLSEELAKEEAE